MNAALILDMHVMVNLHPSKQGLCWPESHDHIVSSSFVFKLTAAEVLVFFFFNCGLKARLTYCTRNKWKTSLQSQKGQIKILAYPQLT